jgi:GH25 family lysozyme M1 (1,4-beta-N-acetylmuramidase)
VIGVDVGPYLFIIAHCNSTDMNPGDKVRRGQLIGYSGATGYVIPPGAAGAHVHLDVLPDGWNVLSSDGRYGRIDPNSVIDYTLQAGGMVNPQGGVTLASNERMVGGSPVNQRNAPKLGADIIRVIPPQTKERWDGYVIGDEVNWNGTKDNRWFKDSAGYASILFFDPTNVDGLPNLTPAPPPVPVPVPVPTPGPTPKPNPPPKPVEPRLHGADISSHQAGLDVRTMGGDFVVIKASEGVGYTDPGLAERAAAVGETKGRAFYHFSRIGATPDNTAAAEAMYFLEVVRPYLRIGDVLVLDHEEHAGNADGSVKPNAVGDTGSAQKFLRIVQGACGGTPLFYTNAAIVNDYDWTALEAEFPLWLASYTGGQIAGFNPPANVPPVTWQAGFKMWQYTGTGRLPGYAKDVDLNVWFGDRKSWDALGITKIPNTPGVPVPPVGKTIPSADQPISDLVKYYTP